VKEHALAALERDLRRVKPGETIVIGTATDPYQPAERQFKITRGVLERLAGCEGLSFGIITKSPLVARDIEVLRRVARHNDLEIYVSLITLDAKLIRVLEARSPVPTARLRALKRLTAAGLRAGLIVAPVLPGITDDVPHLEALLRAARAAGAHFVHAGALRLYAGVRDRFLPLLAEHFPHLRERYGRAYARQSNAPAAYATALKKRIQRLQRKCGLPVNDGMVDRYRARRPAAQLDMGV